MPSGDELSDSVFLGLLQSRTYHISHCNNGFRIRRIVSTNADVYAVRNAFMVKRKGFWQPIFFDNSCYNFPRSFSGAITEFFGIRTVIVILALSALSVLIFTVRRGSYIIREEFVEQ